MIAGIPIEKGYSEEGGLKKVIFDGFHFTLFF